MSTKASAPRALPSLPSAVAMACLALLGASVAYGLFLSLDWPLMHDGAILHYIAWRIMEGAVPYRDVFDMNMPGAYLLHALCISLFGGGDLAFRLFDLSFTLLGALGIAAFSWKHSRLYALTGALGFIAFHLSWGPKSMGERDVLIVPLLLATLYAFKRYLETSKPRCMVVCGLVAGVASGIKPVAVLLALMMAAVLLYRPGERRQSIVALVIMGVTALVPLAAMAAWLHGIGAWNDFLDIAQHFTLGTYARLQSYSLAYTVMFVLLGGYAFALVLFLMYRRSGLAAPDRLAIAIGLLYGLLHFYLQGKGFWYHTYPLAAVTILSMVMLLPRLNCNSIEAMLLYGGAVMLSLHFSAIDLLSRSNLDAYKEKFSFAMLSDAATDAQSALASVPAPIRKAYLEEKPNGAVQFVGYADGHLWNVAYRERWVAPTRHIYSFPWYGVLRSAYMDRQEDAWFESLSSTLPLVMMISSESWPYEDALVYRTLDGKEPWHSWLVEHYRLHKETATYRVYARIK